MHLEEFYLTGTKMFIILEIMRGGSLLDLILERGGLKEGEAKLVFREVCVHACVGGGMGGERIFWSLLGIPAICCCCCCILRTIRRAVSTAAVAASIPLALHCCPG